MGVCYMLQCMDKLAISQATLLNLRSDLVSILSRRWFILCHLFGNTNVLKDLVGSQYTWCSAIFYFRYLAWSWPTSYLIMRLPLGKYLAVSVYVSLNTPFASASL